MAQLSGLFRLGDSAELRYTQKGDAVASLSLAYNYGRKDVLEIITVFSARLYGSRSKKNKELIEAMKKAAEA